MAKSAADRPDKPGLLVYGGTFNPVHIGHLRLAIETRARLGGLIGRVELVPSATPPHKSAKGILPFPLRAEMARAAVASQPGMHVNDLEARRPGPSYTYDTMLEYGREWPADKLFFLLGSQDYELLPTWRRGLELPRLCNLAVAPRGGFRLDDFTAMTKKLWPGAQTCPANSGPLAMRLPNGGKIYYIDAPRLDISASLIRSILLRGESADYLVPGPALELLMAAKETATACWLEANPECSTFHQKN